MPLMCFEKCWRGREDCTSLHAIEATPPGLTEEQFFELDFEPASFVCCGLVKEASRKVAQDAYRVCFKNDVSDEMTDNDDQDLAHLVSVISHAQAIISTRRSAEPTIRVLADEGTIDVPSIQYGNDMQTEARS